MATTPPHPPRDLTLFLFSNIQEKALSSSKIKMGNYCLRRTKNVTSQWLTPSLSLTPQVWVSRPPALLVSISSTFYAQLFQTSLFGSFSLVTFKKKKSFAKHLRMKNTRVKRWLNWRLIVSRIIRMAPYTFFSWYWYVPLLVLRKQITWFKN